MPNIEEVFPSVYLVDHMLSTKSFAPGTRAYGERLLNVEETEYRQWDLYKSKLAGAIHKGLNELPIEPGSLVLYLGAASGTTVSHISDIVGEGGGIFAVEFAQRSMRDLFKLCENRKNILPIFADANKPELYKEEIGDEKVDVLYQDVSQPNQAEILIKNANAYLKEGGHALFCIKSQSIDVTQDPKKTFRIEVEKLEAKGFETIQTILLDPYDRDHMFWHGVKKN